MPRIGEAKIHGLLTAADRVCVTQYSPNWTYAIDKPAHASGTATPEASNFSTLSNFSSADWTVAGSKVPSCPLTILNFSPFPSAFFDTSTSQPDPGRSGRGGSVRSTLLLCFQPHENHLQLPRALLTEYGTIIITPRSASFDCGFLYQTLGLIISPETQGKRR